MRMAISLENKLSEAGIIAAPTGFYAKTNGPSAIGCRRESKAEAEADLDAMLSIIERCPIHQRGAAAVAAMSVRVAL